MSLSKSLVTKLVETIERAELDHTAIAKLTDTYPELTIQDAYTVQRDLRRRRLERGARLVGFKAGLTSKAKMRQMGVDVPIVGFLTDDRARPDGSAIPASQLIQPRVEAEVAFVMKQALRGPGCDRGRVLEATAFVLPAIEILDSRYAGYKFDLVSVIADNTSAALYVAGDRPRDLAGLDLGALDVVLEKNGVQVAIATSDAVLGHPAEAVAMIVNHLAAHDEELPAESFVMSGGITEAVAVEAGDRVTARVKDLGSVSIRFV